MRKRVWAVARLMYVSVRNVALLSSVCFVIKQRD